jgi:hypothetical protein
MSKSRKYNQATKLISTWEELSKCTSETYDIEIDVKGCNGSVTKKNSAFDYSNDYYLSTHTFYGLNYRNSTRELQKRGFNVEIANWDAERLMQ